MKITYEGDYTIKVIFELSLHYGEKAPGGDGPFYIKVKDIARRQNIPFKYLQQIILKLKSAGYVKTKSGNDGGVILARAPERITLGDIVRLSEGTTAPITCVSDEPAARTKCEDEAGCPFRKIWVDVKNSINRIVDGVTFGDIVKKHRNSLALKGNYYYEI